MSIDVYICDTAESRSVLLSESGRAIEYMTESKSKKFGPGAIFKAQIRSGKKFGGLCFADVGGETVLLETHGADKRSQSDVMCMIKKEEDEPGKKKVATTEISLYGKYVIFKTGGNSINFSKKLDKADEEKKKAYSDALSEIAAPYGFVCRTGIFDAQTGAVFAEARALKERYLSLLEKYPSAPICSMIFSGYDLFGRLKIDLDADLIDRVYMNVSSECFSEDEAFWKKSDGSDNITVNPVDDFFEYYGFSGEIAERDQPMVKLPHGGNLVIESTRAMTVIDVNAAGAYSASRGAESNAKAVNLDACSAIARELRFRNIGGTVVIDFISMQREENKKAVMEKLISECAKDRFRIDVSPEMSPLGLAELCRIYR